jgi:hypothetical protein
MIDFIFKGKTIRIPAQLEELTRDQYIEFLKLSSLMTQGYLEPAGFRTHWVSCLLGLKIDYTDYKPEIVEEVSGQLEKLDGFFIYEDRPDGGRTVTPRLRTGRQMLKEYAGWIGPGDMLEGMTFGDFTDCLTILGLVKKAIDAGEPDSEIAVMYEDLTRKMYRPVVNIPKDKPVPVPPALLVVHAVNLFSAVWSQIVSEPVSINGEEVNFAILFNKSGAAGRHAYDDRTGWKGITFEVASSGVFGAMDSLNVTPFWDVLLYLYKCKYEYLHNKNKTSNLHGKR